MHRECLHSAGAAALVKAEGIINSSKCQTSSVRFLHASARRMEMKRRFTFQHDHDHHDRFGALFKGRVGKYWRVTMCLTDTDCVL